MAAYTIKALSLLSMMFGASFVDASPKVVPMQIHRRERNGLERRGIHAVDVTLGNDLSLYYVNASVGTPPQYLLLQLDTGSSDVWLLGPNARNSSGGPTYDYTKSSSAKTFDKGGFRISYVTGSVTGDWVNDTITIGGSTIESLSMGVATLAQDENVPSGIMGIGFDTKESSLGSNGFGAGGYPNIIDVLVSEGLINSKAYSLYLDDLEDATGTIIFGGYDTDKYVGGNLTVLPILPDTATNTINSMTVAWTSLNITDSNGSNAANTTTLPLPAVLDSGTTLTLVPEPVFSYLVDYFGAIPSGDIGFGWLVNCNISDGYGSLDWGFNNNENIVSVQFSELALPALDDTGAPLRFDNGDAACNFGVGLVPDNAPVLLGDTFLRSAYVIYDLENAEIAIGNTIFNTTESNLVEISSGTGNGVATFSSVAPSVAVTNTASAAQVDFVVASKHITLAQLSTAAKGGHVATASLKKGAQQTATGTGATTASPTKNAASTLATAFDPAGLLVISGSFIMVLLGGAFMLFN